MAKAPEVENTQVEPAEDCMKPSQRSAVMDQRDVHRLVSGSADVASPHFAPYYSANFTMNSSSAALWDLLYTKFPEVSGPAGDQDDAERAATEKAATETAASSEKATAIVAKEKAATGKTAAERSLGAAAAAEKAAAEKAAAAEQNASEETAAEQASGEEAVERAAAENATVEVAAAENAAAENVAAEKSKRNTARQLAGYAEERSCGLEENSWKVPEQSTKDSKLPRSLATMLAQQGPLAFQYSWLQHSQTPLPQYLENEREHLGIHEDDWHTHFSITDNEGFYLDISDTLREDQFPAGVEFDARLSHCKRLLMVLAVMKADQNGLTI